jgi:hypothetical protein
MDAFLIFPQLRLLWNPKHKSDRRANIPDIGIGRLTPEGRYTLQGGAELKVAVDVAKSFPSSSELTRNDEFQASLRAAYIQASDQVKSAIKIGAVANNVPIRWIIAVGPYFTIQSFGPFTKDELDTRGHRPSDSGDYEVSSAIEQWRRDAAEKPLPGSVHCIGTLDGSTALHNYLIESAALYNSTERSM